MHQEIGKEKTGETSILNLKGIHPAVTCVFPNKKLGKQV